MTKEKVTNYVVDLCCEMLVLSKDAIKLNSDIAEDLGADGAGPHAVDQRA